MTTLLGLESCEELLDLWAGGPAVASGEGGGGGSGGINWRLNAAEVGCAAVPRAPGAWLLGRPCLASGWGSTGVISHATVPAMNLNDLPCALLCLFGERVGLDRSNLPRHGACNEFE
jgi:hypothetical protein